jgi:hypothetical protein
VIEFKFGFAVSRRVNLQLAVYAAAMIAAAGAQAQTSVGATSGQNQSAASTSGSVISSGAVAVNSYGADSVKTTGVAPSVGFSSSFSADYCAGTVGASSGWLGGSFGGGVPVDKESCVMLRTYERLQQGAASETREEVRLNLKDASYAVLAEISPKIRAVLSRHHVLHGQDAVQSDDSGTVGLQAANYRVEEK